VIYQLKDKVDSFIKVNENLMTNENLRINETPI
jgi:hypothetical protein